jgi:hypothetical protein
MGLTLFREDVFVMDNVRDTKKRIQIQRTFSYSRLGPELMSAAYESLVPTKRMPLSAKGQVRSLDMKEERRWAV